MKPTKTWLWIGLAVLVLGSFLFSKSLWTTISRKKSIHLMQKEMDKLGLEISDTRRKIEDLEKNPRAYETLVREELNYLRPGEKEVRFIGNGKK